MMIDQVLGIIAISTDVCITCLEQFFMELYSVTSIYNPKKIQMNTGPLFGNTLRKKYMNTC